MNRLEFFRLKPYFPYISVRVEQKLTQVLEYPSVLVVYYAVFTHKIEVYVTQPHLIFMAISQK